MKKLIKDFKKRYKESKKEFYWILWYVIYSGITYELFNRPFGIVRNIKIPFDDLIPFIKEFIIIYHLFMPMVILSCILVFIYNKKDYKKVMLTMFLAQTASYIVFVLFQTYVPRYDINLLGNDIFSNLVKFTYSIDNPYSGIPSMHVCNMVLSSIFIYQINLKKNIKIFLISFMTLIAITTVLVKQHVFLDIPGGIIHAIISYYLGIFIYNKISQRIQTNN